MSAAPKASDLQVRHLAASDLQVRHLAALMKLASCVRENGGKPVRSNVLASPGQSGRHFAPILTALRLRALVAVDVADGSWSLTPAGVEQLRLQGRER